MATACPSGDRAALKPSSGACRALGVYALDVDITFYTPAQVAQVLGVSAPSVRRIALVYEGVFGPLPRDERGHRHWPQNALHRTQAAHQALGTGSVASLEAALRLINEGDDLPVPVDLPAATPGPDVLAEVLQELRRLREVVEAQHLELGALREEVRGLRQLPAPAPLLPATPGPDLTAELIEVRSSLGSLQVALTDQGEREAERMRVLLHAYNEAPSPRPTGLTGWLSALFRWR